MSMFRIAGRLLFLIGWFILSGLICPDKMIAQSITSFSPTTITAGTGSILTINGSGFGTDGPGAAKYIGFASSNTSNQIIGAYYPDYISWTDNKIVLSVRPDAGTGSVYLVIGGSVISSLSGLKIYYDLENAIYNNTPLPVKLVNNNNNGGYTFHFFSDFNAKTEANQAFTRALNTWLCATNVNWNIGSPTNVNVVANDGVDMIKIDTDNTELDAGILGQTFLFYNSVTVSRWELTGLDMVFAGNKYNWNFGPAFPTSVQFDFEHVALHELGHAHGLGHVIDITDVMNSGTFPGEIVRNLNTANMDAGKYIMSISTAGAGTYLYPPMEALPAGSCKVLVPVISSFTPVTGGTGTTVTMKGINLSGVNSVSFGNTPAQSFTGITDTSISAVVAAGSTGNINVTTPWGLATIPGFVYKFNQTIQFSPFTSVTYGSADIAAAATSTNNTIPITYSSSNIAVATITANGNIHIIGAGITTITASQNGNANYLAAVPVSQILTVSSASLTVTANIQTKIYGSANPLLTISYKGFVNADNPASLTTQPLAITKRRGIVQLYLNLCSRYFNGCSGCINYHSR
jgi:MBG domain (YGX type)/IPT/TIG domain